MSLFKKVPPKKSLFEFAEDTAEESYHEILKRADEPHEDDHAKVEELLPYLGISWKEAKADFAVIKRSEELKQTIAKAEEAEKAIAIVSPKLAALEKQLRDFEAKMKPEIAVLGNEKYGNEQIAEKKYAAQSELDDLQTRFPRAFGQRKQK